VLGIRCQVLVRGPAATKGVRLPLSAYCPNATVCASPRERESPARRAHFLSDSTFAGPRLSASNPRVLIGWQTLAVNGQPAPALLSGGVHARRARGARNRVPPACRSPSANPLYLGCEVLYIEVCRRNCPWSSSTASRPRLIPPNPELRNRTRK